LEQPMMKSQMLMTRIHNCPHLSRTESRYKESMILCAH
jgi:hypothetical protein